MEKATKEEVEEIMKTPGKVRGVVFGTDARYISDNRGEEAIKEVEQKLEEWGNPIVYKDINHMDWYPIGLRALSLLAAKEVFDWSDEDITKMGHSAPAHSFVVKLLMKYFLTLKQTHEKSPSYWTKHYTVGTLKATDYDEEERSCALQLWDFNIHPILCSYYLGYFRKISELGAQQEITGIEEKDCSHKGGPYHEFIIRW